MKKESWWCTLVMCLGDPTMLFINQERQQAHGNLEEVLAHLSLPSNRRFRMYLRHVGIRDDKINHVILLHCGPFPAHLDSWKSDVYPWVPVGWVRSDDAKERILLYGRML